MTRAISIAPTATGFEDFLYTRISQDDAVAPLSVLSVIAGYDIDPWEEAARLSRLPESAAIEELVALLGALDAASATPPGPACTAARLIALLPHRRGLPFSLRDTFTAARAVQWPSVLLVVGILFFLACIALMIRGR